MSQLDTALSPLVDELNSWVHDQLDGTSYIDSSLASIESDSKLAKLEIQKLMLELLRDTITESSDVAEIGEIFAKKVGEL